MTVQEAKEQLLHDCDMLQTDLGIPYDLLEEFDYAIQALEEVEQYRALGTVEELKEAMEKQVAKKQIETERFNCLNYECPICGGGLYHEQQYCDECGQALKWGEEDEQG